jgi:hypothetical protein
MRELRSSRSGRSRGAAASTFAQSEWVTSGATGRMLCRQSDRATRPPPGAESGRPELDEPMESWTALVHELLDLATTRTAGRVQRLSDDTRADARHCGWR